MAFSDPQNIVDRFGLHSGQLVADLGTGSGFYTLEASKLVGEGGKVFAIDIQEDLLKRLRNTLQQQHITNVELIHADIDQGGGTRIADHHVDAVFVCNVFFQIEHKDVFLAEVKRILKPEGRVLFVDWSDAFSGLGPNAEHVVTAEKAKEYFTKAGFTELSTFQAGDHHYGLIFRNV